MAYGGERFIEIMAHQTVLLLHKTDAYRLHACVSLVLLPTPDSYVET